MNPKQSQDFDFVIIKVGVEGQDTRFDIEQLVRVGKQAVCRMWSRDALA